MNGLVKEAIQIFIMYACGVESVPMTKMTSREQFEDKYGLLMGKTIASIRDCRHESGYREREGCTMEIAWRMWQASRSSIELNLTSEWDISSDGSRHYDADSVDEQLLALGIKVKK